MHTAAKLPQRMFGSVSAHLVVIDQNDEGASHVVSLVRVLASARSDFARRTRSKAVRGPRTPCPCRRPSALECHARGCRRVVERWRARRRGLSFDRAPRCRPGRTDRRSSRAHLAECRFRCPRPEAPRSPCAAPTANEHATGLRIPDRIQRQISKNALEQHLVGPDECVALANDEVQTLARRHRPQLSVEPFEHAACSNGGHDRLHAADHDLRKIENGVEEILHCIERPIDPLDRLVQPHDPGSLSSDARSTGRAHASAGADHGWPQREMQSWRATPNPPARVHFPRQLARIRAPGRRSPA